MITEEQAGWKWFMAVNHDGGWIITEGIASVAWKDEAFSATLLFSIDTPPYLSLVGSIANDDSLEVEGVSTDPEVPRIILRGGIQRDDDSNLVKSIFLTDGWTIIGLAHADK